MSSKVSIIVPVYNAEQTLKRCVDSVLVQTYTDWELILVDDGSTDASPAFCDEYAAKDLRIHVIHKLNGGVSSARNAALVYLDRIGTEKYITFIDSDDYVTNNYLEHLCSMMVDGVQMACVGALFSSGYISTYQENKVWDVVHDDILCCLQLYCFATPWGKIFLSDVINRYKIRFNEKLRVAEDSCFIWEYLRHINKMRTSKATYYRYYTCGVVAKYGMPLLEYNLHLSIINYHLKLLQQTLLGTDITSIKENQDYFFFKMLREYLFFKNCKRQEFMDTISSYKFQTQKIPSYNQEKNLHRLLTWISLKSPWLGFGVWRVMKSINVL